jgi:ribosomal protein L17
MAKSEAVKEAEARVKELKIEENNIIKLTAKKQKEAEKATNKLIKLDKEIKAAELRQAVLKVVPGVDYIYGNNPTWGIEVLARTISPISGSKSADVFALAGKPDANTRDLKGKLIQKEAEMILKKTKPLPEEIDGIRDEIESTKNDSIKHSVPLNILHRDRQTMGEDDKPLPVLGQHMLYAPFREMATAAYYREFKIYTQLSAHKGWASNKWMKHYVIVDPKHVRLYHDKDLKKPINESDLVREGQNPCGDVKGFSQYEVTPLNVFFKFTMTFNPRGKFPALSNKELVLDCFQQSLSLGLGSRRGANYGMWEVIDIKESKISKSRLFDSINGKNKKKKAA